MIKDFKVADISPATSKSYSGFVRPIPTLLLRVSITIIVAPVPVLQNWNDVLVSVPGLKTKADGELYKGAETAVPATDHLVCLF